jgi:hypothetical protein
MVYIRPRHSISHPAMLPKGYWEKFCVKGVMWWLETWRARYLGCLRVLTNTPTMEGEGHLVEESPIPPLAYKTTIPTTPKSRRGGFDKLAGAKRSEDTRYCIMGPSGHKH